jgi:hypothetical protein
MHLIFCPTLGSLLSQIILNKNDEPNLTHY